MPTTRTTVETTWTNLGAGPLAVGLNRGRMWFQCGDTAPTDDRAGYLHTAQGQVRLLSFAKTQTVWARAVEAVTDVTLVTGLIASASQDNLVMVYNRYSDLPDPTTLDAGTFGVVVADPLDFLNGLHVTLGAQKGQPGTYWQAAS